MSVARNLKTSIMRAPTIAILKLKTLFEPRAPVGVALPGKSLVELTKESIQTDISGSIAPPADNGDNQ